MEGQQRGRERGRERERADEAQPRLEAERRRSSFKSGAFEIAMPRASPTPTPSEVEGPEP